MARAPRDHPAEQQRRNDLARERGYRNRGEQRRQVERGIIPAARPRAMRNVEHIHAQALLEAHRRDRAFDWSAAHGKRYQGRYNPDLADELGYSESAYTDAYLKAWVEGERRYTDVRHSGGSRALFHWFVEVIGWYTMEEYEERYGPVPKD